MGPMLQELMSNEMAAVVVPLVIFCIILILLIRKLISFGITFILLIFVIIAGLTIANYDVFRDRVDKGYLEKLDTMQETIDGFKESVVNILEEMRAEMGVHMMALEEAALKNAPPAGSDSVNEAPQSSAIPQNSTAEQPDFPWDDAGEAEAGAKTSAKEDTTWQPPEEAAEGVESGEEKVTPKFPWE